MVAGTAAALLLLLFTFATPEPMLLVFAALGVAAIGYFLTSGPYREYKRAFKSRIIRPIVGFVDDALRYSPEGCIPESSYRLSGLFRQGVDRYRGDDRVQGTIGQTDVDFSEIHAEYKTTTIDSKGNRRTQWHTIFKGLFFSADFNKEFRGTTYVLPDTAEKLFGSLGAKLQSLGKSHGDLIKLEDPDFERAFVVYGSDPTEARYILSPALMARIMAFKTKSGRPIHLSFVGSRVYVAVSYRRRLFEPSLFRTVLDFGQIQEYFADLELAVAIVEDLNLNTRIWTKA